MSNSARNAYFDTEKKKLYTCEDKSGEIIYLRTSFCFPTDSKFTLSK